MTRKEKLKLVCCIMLIAVFIALIARQYVQQNELINKYNEAVELIMSESYTEGRLILEEIEDENFKDTKDFITYCRMAERKQGASISFYWSDVSRIDFRYCTDTQRSELLKKVSNLENWYDEQSKERKRQEEADKEKLIRSGVPYVGMPEEYIGKTSLGLPSSDTRSNYEVINGNQYLATIYDFIKNGRVVFTARCVRGFVTEVWDKSNDKPYVPDYSWMDDDDDPYNASDYSNEEDFYMDHYYDFHDYYQAEAYWRDHRDD